MMRSLLAALTVLTVFPAGKFCPAESELQKSVSFFPAVGVLLGLLVWGAGEFAGNGMTAWVLLALLPEFLTRGFHLDGLADTADGFFSGRDRERKLEIMHDSRIGSMGVLAIVSLLLFKIALLADAPAGWAPRLAGVSLVCGRTGILWHIAASGYARKSGLGRVWFHSGKPVGGIIAGTALCLVAGWFLAGGLTGLAAAGLAAVLCPVLWSEVTRRVIGGATGDTIGACEEGTELLFLAGAVLGNAG